MSNDSNKTVWNQRLKLSAYLRRCQRICFGSRQMAPLSAYLFRLKTGYRLGALRPKTMSKKLLRASFEAQLQVCDLVDHRYVTWLMKNLYLKWYSMEAIRCIICVHAYTSWHIPVCLCACCTNLTNRDLRTRAHGMQMHPLSGAGRRRGSNTKQLWCYRSLQNAFHSRGRIQRSRNTCWRMCRWWRRQWRGRREGGTTQISKEQLVIRTPREEKWTKTFVEQGTDSRVWSFDQFKYILCYHATQSIR